MSHVSLFFRKLASKYYGPVLAIHFFVHVYLIACNNLIDCCNCFLYRFGELDLNVHSGNEQTSGISKYIMHPDYSSYPHPLRYDFALMKLTRPVMMNDHVRMVCLPKSTEKLPAGTVLWETGWGKTSTYSKMYDFLKELEVIIVDPKRSPRRVCVEFSKRLLSRSPETLPTLFTLAIILVRRLHC